jgi:hypothetical protein
VWKYPRWPRKPQARTKRIGRAERRRDQHLLRQHLRRQAPDLLQTTEGC